ncbi:bifunctional metallophosphatase/5'-nucleotidase [Labilibaculum filiforme]|uniref:Bifunctional metallophosphatase/5'-nucleotidase n=1 Tax=Labilibaculum filiforme TaxID=1940526 RepID=A0A2N3HR43_9BACT|nr:bifunctional UDP-sugar hydrolase/5'-nucleotidase [Labilibaculum filiforme]PKQ60523.1 bifunctional metallophosphatase/5'-nucleotidase [Labilibaculum filiforme]
MKKSYIYLLFVTAFILCSCGEQKVEHVKIKVLGTSDVHGALFPYDLVGDKATSSSLAQVFAYVDEQRKKGDSEVILLDNGDILQGDPLVYYSNFEKTETTHICAELMNFMQYDAATVGNHDIEPGHEVYDRLVKEYQFPWMAANAVRNSDGEPYFQPYTIIEKQGVKIAVLGLITSAIPKWLPEKIWSGMHFEPMLESAQKWIKIIEEKEKPDFVIGLFHSGAGEEEEKLQDNPENASVLIAEKVSGIDMIICGHDHQENILWVENPDKEKVLLINPQSRANFLAEVDIDFSWNKEAKKYQKTLTPNLIEGKDLPSSKEYVERFQPLFDEVKSYVSRPVGTFKTSISTKDAMFGDSPFIDLVQNIQLDLADADVSFASPLSFNAIIDSGELQVRDLFNLYRFENLLYTMNLTGKEIRGFLEFSYKDWFQQMEKSSDPMLFIETTEKGSKFTTMFFNYSSAEGIDYVVDLRKPYGEKVTILKMTNGEPFEEAKMYRVALNSYRGNGGGNHLTQGAGLTKEELTSRVVNATTKDLRYYLMKWIEEKGTVDIQCNNNWKVIPEDWCEEAKKREYKLLYGEK